MFPAVIVRTWAMDVLKRHGRLIHISAWMACVAALWLGAPTSVRDVRLTAPRQQPVDIPYSVRDAKGVAAFESILVKDWRTPAALTVRVDDCVESVSVDGREFFTHRCVACDHCRPTRIQLPADLTPGEHTMVWRTKDHGGNNVLDIREAHGLPGWIALLMWLGGAALLLVAERWLCGRTHAWIALGAVLLAFQYWMITDPFARQHDVDGHREYIDHLINTLTLPKVKQGWETWQPPLYYLLSSVFVTGTRYIADAVDIFRRVQVLAALLYVAAVVIAALRWRRLNLNPATGWIGLVLFAVLPANVFISGRVNNDALMPLWGTLVTLLAWEYYQDGRWRTVVLSTSILLLSLMTKTSSLSLVAGAGLTLMVTDHLRRRSVLDRLARMAAMGVPLACWLAFWMLRNHEQTGEYLYVNAALTDNLRVPNNAWRYLSFDFRAYLGESHFNTFGGELRKSLPAALATSTLTGEFNLEWVSPEVQTFMRAAFIPVVFLLLLGLVTPPARGGLKPWVPAALVFGAHAFFMLSYNWRYPYACNSDARLWGPAYFPASVLAAWGYEVALQRFRGWPRRVLLVGPPLFFITLAVFYHRLLQ